MTRTPLQLAALASSAVPGLDPATVQAATAGPGHYYEVAFVTDSQHRMWVVRAPVTAAAGAQMDTTVALLGLIGRRLPFAVPAPRGFVGVPEGRVVVYPHITGRPITFATLPPGPGLAAELGRTLAAIHNLDRALFDEASMPVYEAETYRTRRLADLDRGAATGHVPTALLSRWERALEDVSMWRFAPTPVHGDLTGDQVLVVFEDEEDVTTGRVRGITGWDDAQVADPAEDFAAIVTQCEEQTIETVFEAYANSRVERPDPHLRRRARLAAELRALTALLTATSAGRRDVIRACAADLRELDERTINEPDDLVPSDPRLPEPPRDSAFDREQLDEPDPPSDTEPDDTEPDDTEPDDTEPDDTEPDDTGIDDLDRRAEGSAAVGGEAAHEDDEGWREEGADVGDETQPISSAYLGDLTAVIPQDELDRIRRVPATQVDDAKEADEESAVTMDAAEPDSGPADPVADDPRPGDPREPGDPGDPGATADRGEPGGLAETDTQPVIQQPRAGTGTDTDTSR